MPRMTGDRYREESDRMRHSDAVPIRPERICKEISAHLKSS